MTKRLYIACTFLLSVSSVLSSSVDLSFATLDQNNFNRRQLKKPQTNDQHLQELATAEAKWKQLDYHDYTYQYKFIGPNPDHIAYPWTVTVSNSVSVTGKDDNGNSIVWNSGGPEPQTMEELFEKIHTAISKNVKTIEVSYSLKYGYPESIFIVYDPDTPDAAYHAKILDFSPEPEKGRGLLQETRDFAKPQLNNLAKDVHNRRLRGRTIG